MMMSEMNSQSFLEIDKHFKKLDTVYFDSATKNLVPSVIEESYFSLEHDIEWARNIVKNYISAEKSKEIVFTFSNAHSVSLIISSLRNNWRSKDTIIIPESEHSVNYEPWHAFCKETGCNFETVNIIKDGRLDLGHLEEILQNTDGKVLFSTSQVSAVTGYVQPVKEVFSLIKEYDGFTVLDCTYSITHESVNVCEDLVDFLFFHSANTYNVSGTGVLYAKQKFLEKIQPSFLETLHALPYPEKLESKYLNKYGIVSLAESLSWITLIGLDNIKSKYLLINADLQMMLNDLDFVDIFHPNHYKGGIISFSVRNMNSLDVMDYLSQHNIKVSAGTLDSNFMYDKSVVRISWGVNNKKEDTKILLDALEKIYKGKK
jgi:cysteine desulfurase/selenocysteine lyase